MSSTRNGPSVRTLDRCRSSLTPGRYVGTLSWFEPDPPPPQAVAARTHPSNSPNVATGRAQRTSAMIGKRPRRSIASAPKPHGLARVLEHLVPPSVACAETRGDRLDIDLYPSEREALGRAVDKRRREFTTGRACARDALTRLGVRVVAIPSGPHGEPLWPPGIVGSITHCRGYAACAVATADAVTALGIDAEPNEPLPPRVLEDVVRGRELDLVAAWPRRTSAEDQVDPSRLVFSAKEAVYKAWFPLTGRWLGFEDVELAVDPAGSEFSARLLVAGPVVGGMPLTEFAGRWRLQNGIICTAVVVQ